MPLLDPTVGYLILADIALLFGSASVHKLRRMARFTEIFVAYRVLPEPLSRRMGWLIPVAELMAAVTLLWVPTRPLAAAPAAVILMAYAAALGLNLARRRRDLDCGCTTTQDRRPIAPWMVCRNLLLAGFVGVTALPWSLRSLDPADFLTLTGGVVVSVALYAAVDRLLGEVAPKAMRFRATS